MSRIEKVIDLIEIAGGLPASTVVVVGGHRVEDLRLVESARDHGIVDRIILVGLKDRITKAVAEVGIEIDEKDIVAAEGDEQIAKATVDIIKTGVADIVLKGAISTPILNRNMLPLAVRSTVSLVTIFDAAVIAGGRPILMTDAGVTTVCNFGRMQDLVRNAIDVAHTVMGIDRPRVAMLSANEKQIPSLPSTWIALETAKRAWPDAVVCGPLSFDLATDPESVAIKGLPDLPSAAEVAGRADIIVCPGIDTANTLYKTISSMNKYGEASLASITIGFPMPYIILSRADSLETRLVSVALSAVYVQNNLKRQPQGRAKESQTPVAQTYRVLAFNPGSTSVKVALYEGDHCIRQEEEACKIALGGTTEQRRNQEEQLAQLVYGMMDKWNAGQIDAVASRGGFMPRPPEKLSGGSYIVAERRDGRIVVDETIVSAVRDRPEREHASNYGAPVAAALAQKLGVPAVVVDPVVIDEYIPEAEVSGYAPIVRRSILHALSVRAASKRAARDVGRPLENVNLVVAHLGGGITVASVRGGKVIDSNISLLGGGPFTPQRAGGLPVGDLIDLCYSGRFTRDELITELTQKGGLESYLGTHRMEDIENRIEAGDKHATLVINAMVYQIAKEIGKAFVAAGCDVEAIVLTGGLTRSKLVRDPLRRRVIRLAPVIVYEGSLEMAALAAGAIEVLSGRQTPLRYKAPAHETSKNIGGTDK
jgi:butyrate kinase